MQYINETLKNWLLGKSEIDQDYFAVPPKQKTPDRLLELYKKAEQDSNKTDLTKINKELEKLGYEVKVLHLLQKKE